MLKSDNANQRQFSARVRQHSVRKFHKAILWAEQLSALCKVHCDQRTQREAEAYELYMKALYAVETEKWEGAQENLMS